MSRSPGEGRHERVRAPVCRVRVSLDQPVAVESIQKSRDGRRGHGEPGRQQPWRDPLLGGDREEGRHPPLRQIVSSEQLRAGRVDPPRGREHRHHQARSLVVAESRQQERLLGPHCIRHPLRLLGGLRNIGPRLFRRVPDRLGIERSDTRRGGFGRGGGSTGGERERRGAETDGGERERIEGWGA